MHKIKKVLFFVLLILGIFLYKFLKIKLTTTTNYQPIIYFCTYGDEKFKESRQRIATEAKEFGCFDDIYIFTPEKLSQDFKTKYENVLAKKRGGGYWIWKFEVLKQMLDITKEGDYIFYSDAGSTIYPGFDQEIKEWIAILEKSEYKNLSFQMKYIEKEWSVDELFKIIENKYSEKNSVIQEIKMSGQLFATAMLIKNNKHSRDLMQTCFDIIDFDNNVITDEYNEKNKKENEKFNENRHDQSILSCVRKLWGTTIMDESKIKCWHDTRIRK